jgi:hypothetical protein
MAFRWSSYRGSSSQKDQELNKRRFHRLEA